MKHLLSLILLIVLISCNKPKLELESNTIVFDYSYNELSLDMYQKIKIEANCDWKVSYPPPNTTPIVQLFMYENNRTSPISYIKTYTGDLEVILWVRPINRDKIQRGTFTFTGEFGQVDVEVILRRTDI